MNGRVAAVLREAEWVSHRHVERLLAVRRESRRFGADPAYRRREVVALCERTVAELERCRAAFVETVARERARLARAAFSGWRPSLMHPEALAEIERARAEVIAAAEALTSPEEALDRLRSLRWLAASDAGAKVLAVAEVAWRRGWSDVLDTYTGPGSGAVRDLVAFDRWAATISDAVFAVGVPDELLDDSEAAPAGADAL